MFVLYVMFEMFLNIINGLFICHTYNISFLKTWKKFPNIWQSQISFRKNVD